MCEDLEKKYAALLLEYRQKVTAGMPAEDQQSYNEVLFSAHSCGIEGNSYTVSDTQALWELGLGVVPQGKPLVETMEMLDHFHAFEQMAQTLQEPLTEDYLLRLHKTLTEHTIVIIPREAKDEYIRALKLFHSDSIEYLVAFFYQTAIRRMQSELRQKGNNSAQTMRFLF